MQSLLDEHMPVDDDDRGGGALKKRGLNLFTIMLISLSAAAMVYVTARVVKTKFMSAHTAHHYHHKHRHHAGIDSLADADSLLNDSLAENRDSLNQVKGISGIDAQKDQLSASDKSVAKKNLDNVSLAARDSAGRRAQGIKDNNADAKKDEASAPQRGRGQNNATGRQTGSGSNHSAKNNNISAGPGNPGKSAPSALNNTNTGQNSNSTGNGGTSATISPSSPFLQHNEKILLDDPRQIFGVTIADPNQKQVSTYIYPVPQQSAQAAEPGKIPKMRNGRQSSTSNLEWGALIGINAPGSFTAKSQNSNFYSSLPVDGFLGLYAAYDVNDKWAIGSQIRVLSPSVISGNYQIPHIIKRDSSYVTTYRAQADSRKLYSVQIPIYAAYKLNNVFSFKLGPVISLPTKQFSTAKTDSASMALLSQSHYDQKMDLGVTGGVSVRYKRLSFDITYLRGITSHKVTSDSLSYNVHNSQLQFTIGIQIGGKRK
jgi:hypothetical protein